MEEQEMIYGGSIAGRLVSMENDGKRSAGHTHTHTDTRTEAVPSHVDTTGPSLITHNPHM